VGLRSHACMTYSSFAMGARTKSKLKSRPKYKAARSLKGRKMKAKKKAAHRRGTGRNKARRARKGKKQR